MHKQYICDSPWFSNAYFAPVSWGQGQQWCLEPWWPILPRRFPKSWGVPPVIIHFHRIFHYQIEKNHPAITPLFERKPPNLQRWTSATAKVKTYRSAFGPLPHVSWPRQGSAIVCPHVLPQQLCTTLLFERWKANIVQRPKPLLSGAKLVTMAIVGGKMQSHMGLSENYGNPLESTGQSSLSPCF